jgi:hypothetical protein
MMEAAGPVRSDPIRKEPRSNDTDDDEDDDEDDANEQ